MDLYPTNIQQIDADTLGIHWSDGVESTFNVFKLRCACPCANCVDEMTGDKLLDPKRVAPDVKPVDLAQVGNYAIQISWSDGHNTGIYSFRSLKEMEPELQAGSQ